MAWYAQVLSHNFFLWLAREWACDPNQTNGVPRGSERIPGKKLPWPREMLQEASLLYTGSGRKKCSPDWSWQLSYNYEGKLSLKQSLFSAELRNETHLGPWTEAQWIHNVHYMNQLLLYSLNSIAECVIEGILTDINFIEHFRVCIMSKKKCHRSV